MSRDQRVKKIKAAELLSGHLELLRISLNNLTLIPLTPSPLGKKSSYTEASSSIQEQFREIQEIYINNRAYVSEEFAAYFDSITEGMRLLSVLREITRRHREGLSSRDRSVAIDTEKKASAKATSLINICAKAIKLLISQREG